MASNVETMREEITKLEASNAALVSAVEKMGTELTTDVNELNRIIAELKAGTVTEEDLGRVRAASAVVTEQVTKISGIDALPNFPAPAPPPPPVE